MFSNVTFQNPEFFWLFAILPVLVAWTLWQRNRRQAKLFISNTRAFKASDSVIAKLAPGLFLLRLLEISALIVAMARPQSVDEYNQIKKTEGIDIVLCIDISGSMLARDFRPNRLEALKNLAAQFIRNRPNDRIGLVVFAGESFTKTPVTTDKEVVLRTLSEITFDNRMEQGTAIGTGLSTAVNRLKESKALSKIIILMTDGVNNAGAIDPRIAAELASEYNIKTYTIGVGTNGTAPSPVAIDANGNFIYQNVPVEIDEKLMEFIAQRTGGLYFRATGNEKLKEIYDEIDKLEKTEIEEFTYTDRKDLYRPLVVLALGLLMLEFLLKNTLFKSFI